MHPHKNMRIIHVGFDVLRTDQESEIDDPQHEAAAKSNGVDDWNLDICAEVHAMNTKHAESGIEGDRYSAGIIRL